MPGFSVQEERAAFIQSMREIVPDASLLVSIDEKKLRPQGIQVICVSIFTI